MTFDEYQVQALQTASPDLDLYYALAKLTVEAAEALQLHCKEEYHHKLYTREQMAEELGDALWYLALAARERGMSLDDIAAANIAKLCARHGGAYNAAHYTGEAR
jgi:NTP pyrophosphatase (non-canonical NTP hydrolase)